MLEAQAVFGPPAHAPCCAAPSSTNPGLQGCTTHCKHIPIAPSTPSPPPRPLRPASPVPFHTHDTLNSSPPPWQLHAWPPQHRPPQARQPTAQATQGNKPGLISSVVGSLTASCRHTARRLSPHPPTPSTCMGCWADACLGIIIAQGCCQPGNHLNQTHTGGTPPQQQQTNNETSSCCCCWGCATSQAGRRVCVGTAAAATFVCVRCPLHEYRRCMHAVRMLLLLLLPQGRCVCRRSKQRQAGADRRVHACVQRASAQSVSFPADRVASSPLQVAGLRFG